MKRLFTLLLLSFAALSCEMTDEKLDKRDWVVFAEGTELTANVPSKQIVLNYHFESTLDWEVKTDAEWLEIDPMSGKAGKDIKIQIKVAKNKDKEGRTGYADLTLSNDERYRITINQAGEGDENDDIVVDIPNNQIWYTSIDGEIVEPYSGEYNEYAEAITTFGVNIVSNTYADGKGVIEFDGDVTTIGKGAFYYCSGLTSVTIPDSVTTIGDRAFAGCSSLQEFKSKFASEDGRCLIIDGTLYSFASGCGATEYTIPNSVTTIRAWAFAHCSSLTSITIPDSVTAIGNCAFYECSSLTSVYYMSDISAWCNISFDYSFFNPFNLYLNNELVTDLTIPDSVTTIGYVAFAYCSSLTSVTIPDSVTTIGDYAFQYCSSLTSVTIPDSVTTIGVAAFYDCTSLTSVTIPDSVTMIGEWVFAHCSSLTSVTIPDSVTTIGNYTFCDCSSLTSVTIPNSVTTIGNGAFQYCSSLTSVAIPDSVTTIGYAAFYNCGSLTSVTIPDSVTTIGDYAFNSCSSLESLTIGDSVATIGYAAFVNCENLNTVYCKAINPPTIVDNNGYWFGFAKEDESGNICNIGCTIYVPTESVEAYKSAHGWSEYASDIVGYNF